MNDVFLLLTILGFLGIPICLIITVTRLTKKKKIKSTMISCAISACICIISFIGFGLTIPDEPKSTTISQSIDIPVSSEEYKSQEFEKSNASAEDTSAVESSAIETHASTPETSAPESTTESTASLSEKDIFIKSLTSNPDVTAEAAGNAYDILVDELGFEKIKIEKNISGTLFEVKADGYNLKMTISDKLYMLICGDYNIYQDDTINYTKQDLENRKIGNNDSKYYAMAIDAVSLNLKNPSSANFCSLGKCQMARNGEYVVVKGYVDATNSFNASVRNDFVVELRIIDLSTYTYETIYLNINGESSGTYIDIK